MAAKTLSSSGVLYTDRRVFYPDPMDVAELYPSETPFISTVFAQGADTVPDVDYKLFEHRSGWRYQYLDVNAASPAGP